MLMYCKAVCCSMFADFIFYNIFSHIVGVVVVAVQYFMASIYVLHSILCTN